MIRNVNNIPDIPTSRQVGTKKVLVNADESGYARAAIETARSQIFQTVSGIRLLDAMYPENVSGMAYNEIVSI